MQVVAHNLAMMNISGYLGKVGIGQSKTTEKLSSGYHINRAADDAAGLCISENMRRQIRGLNRAARNVMDGISYCNVADGALAEIHSMLGRMMELSVESANGTNSDMDRNSIDQEVQQLKAEMNRTFRSTTFNDKKIWMIPMVPVATGDVRDFAVYNASDSLGSYAGGIEYKNHRYSWEELGIAYDRATQTFQETKDVSSLAFLIDDGSTSVDDYNGGVKADFSIRVKKGQPLSSVEKTYSWSTNAQGILIDNCFLDGSNMAEGDTSWGTMGIVPGQKVWEGTYSFEYYGMKVSFDVPIGGLDWDEFVDEISNTGACVDWHSTYAGVSSRDSATIKSMTSEVKIDAGTKDLINESGYTVSADKDGVAVEYNNGVTSTKTEWKDIKDDSLGCYIGYWGEKANGHDVKGNISVYEDAEYRYSDIGKGGFIEFSFQLDPTGSSQQIAADLSSTKISGNVISPTAVEITNSGAVGSTERKTSVTGTCEFTFGTQRDLLARQFSANDEKFAFGDLTANGAGGYSVEFKSKSDSSKTITMTSSANIKGEILAKLKAAKADYVSYIQAQQLIDPYVDYDSGKRLAADDVTARFTAGGNRMDLTLKLSEITYGDVKDITTDADFEGLAERIIDANKSISAKGNGESRQILNYTNAGMKQTYVMNSPVVDKAEMRINIMAGDTAEQEIMLAYDVFRTSVIGVGAVNTLTKESSISALDQIGKAIQRISEQRGQFGAYTNRLEHTYYNDIQTSENLQAAESRIRDAKMDEEMVKHAKEQLLMQAGQSIMAQANQTPQGILALLQ